MLNEEEKALFRRLSVFIGGCTLEAAEEICDTVDDSVCDVLNGMASLEDKSLLKRQEFEDAPRFAMLETIREYAEGRLRYN